MLSLKPEVGTLRLEGAAVDDPSLRSRALATIGAVAVGASIPHAAVLIVRKLEDPRPGALALGTRDLRPPAAWQRALDESIADMYAVAVRPALAPVPPEAVAVVFADEAEMLACLVGDLAAAVALDKWWWRQLLRRYISFEPYAVLAAEPELVPAVVVELYRRDAAMRVCRALGPRRAGDLLRAALHAHGLPELARVMDRSGPSAPAAAASAPADPRIVQTRSDLWSSTAPGHVDGAIGTARHGPGPWGEWLRLPPRYEELDRVAVAFVALSLGIQQHPAHVRTRAFRAEVARWLEGAPIADRIQEEPEPARDSISKVARRRSSESSPGRTTSDSSHPRARRTTPQLSPQTPAAGPEAERPPQTLLTTEEPPTRAVATEGFPAVRSLKARVDASPAQSSALQEAASEDGAEQQVLKDGLTTDLGGIFFLLHVVRPLVDTSPCAGAGPWEMFEGIARGLLATVPESLADTAARDPLWAALARLAGRKPDAPLPRARSAAAYRVPHEIDLGPARSFWAIAGRRVVVWTSLGFVVADGAVPSGRDARKRVDGICAAYGIRDAKRRPATDAPRAVLTGELTQSLRGALRRWCALAVPYVRWALSDMLSINPDEAVRHAARRSATIFATPTHLDVVFDIDAISLSVRTAGLDADPGWLPDFGRAVAFHFE